MASSDDIGRSGALPAAMASPRSVSKVSVSLPNELTASVRERVGRGQFSAYVTNAVVRQLELDRLAELVAEIEERRGGPASEELLREAEAAWQAD